MRKKLRYMGIYPTGYALQFGVKDEDKELHQPRYTLYMNNELIDSSDELMELVDKFEESYTDGCNGVIMDNLTDEVAYGG